MEWWGSRGKSLLYGHLDGGQRPQIRALGISGGEGDGSARILGIILFDEMGQNPRGTRGTSHLFSGNFFYIFISRILFQKYLQCAPSAPNPKVILEFLERQVPCIKTPLQVFFFKKGVSIHERRVKCHYYSQSQDENLKKNALLKSR